MTEEGAGNRGQKPDRDSFDLYQCDGLASDLIYSNPVIVGGHMASKRHGLSIGIERTGNIFSWR
jgi:hypothetical protein